MENQLTFADSEYSQKRRLTRKEKFLGRMEKLVPWIQIIDLIEPFYAKAGNGRRPYPLETMLRIHYLQQWYSLRNLRTSPQYETIRPLFRSTSYEPSTWKIN